MIIETKLKLLKGKLCTSVIADLEQAPLKGLKGRKLPESPSTYSEGLKIDSKNGGKLQPTFKDPYL